MPSVPSSSAWSRSYGLILPITIVGAILVFIVPVPPAVLDLLISANITLAVLVLLTVLAVRSPLEFGAFPTLLLTTTLTRLVLNVATVRLVLTRGGEYGLEAAGGVIRAFGEFVARDQVVVGAILFAILVVIQFVVITKGATRISEVAARFMLDGLPGRQMAIDADLHAGLIDQAEAVRRRDSLYRQADFFGAMDGAGKFVRGDAVAGVIITVVNVVGGLYIGMVQHGMPVGEAVDVFTKLTIGDGLVTQVPAFLISLAAGLIVTRSSSETDLGRDVVGQLLGRAEVLGVASAFLFALSFTSLPKLPLWTLAGALGAGAYLRRHRVRPSEPVTTPAPVVAPPVPGPVAHAEPPADTIDELLHVDLLELEIGYRLIPLADQVRGGDLLERVRGVRQRVAREMGLIVPQVRVRDEIGLGAHEYRLKVRGAVVGQGTAYATRLLAVPPMGLVTRPEGRDGVDPTSGLPAVWIHADGREVAALAGCRVFEASAVIALHFEELVRLHADELMTHDQVARLLERARATAPGLVDEVVPGLLRAGEVQRVLQGLLRERVSVRDVETILEALAEHAGKTRDTDVLLEHVRRALGRQITQQYRGPDGHLRGVILSRALDARLAAAGQSGDSAPASVLGPEAVRGIIQAVAQSVGPLLDADLPPVVVCSAEARPVLKDITHADLPRLIVLSQREVPRDTPFEPVGSVDEEDVPLVVSLTTSSGHSGVLG
jgi:flagellar biosynthesis protein FlhA